MITYEMDIESNGAYLIAIRQMHQTQENVDGLIEELSELVKNINLSVLEKKIVNLKEINPRTYIGSGKLAEIVARAKFLGAKYLVFDEELSPAQQRNIEKESGLCVIDRHEVILDIFASRARTREARLQVNLAQLEYSLPRLKRAWLHLNRQRGGGVTQRGEGESQLELDQRMIRLQISKLKKELVSVRQIRDVQRKKRMKSNIPSIAIVGYTNAGKSSLMNMLVGENLLSEDKLFATLDPTTRQLELGCGYKVLITDTVGFVRKLPHHFVEAFKATLEESVVADLLLHIVDASNPDALLHIETTNNVLKELGADTKKIIFVLNKFDIVRDEVSFRHLCSAYPDAIITSTRTMFGMQELLRRIEDTMPRMSKIVTLRLPHTEHKLLSNLISMGIVKSKKYLDEFVEVVADIPMSKLERFEVFLAQ